MGKPKFSRKKYETPSHPWQEDRIKAENEIVKKYGLKNKREVWKAKTKLRKLRGQARELLVRVKGPEAQGKKESDQLLMHLNKMNFLPLNSALDDVLALEIDSILSRRLQTLIYLKGLASTPDQARQLIIHGHIAIDDRKVTVPGYLVNKDEESKITYTKASPLNDQMHPARPHPEVKFGAVPKKVKAEEPKKEETVEKKEETPKPEVPKDQKEVEKLPKEENQVKVDLNETKKVGDK
jgi:small subunit ribosomal protein S4